MVEINRIVCPVDFSEFSRLALDYAMALTHWYEGRVTVVHVHSVAIPPAALAPGNAAGAEPIVMSAVDRELLMQELASFVGGAGARPVPVDIQLVEGTVWREIVALAETTPADPPGASSSAPAMLASGPLMAS